MDDGQRKKLATQLLHILRDPEATSFTKKIICENNVAEGGNQELVRRGDQRRKQKPIDVWFALWGFVVTLILFLAPRTPPIVGLCLLALFGFVVHPIWTFWWIEKSLWRRAVSLLVAWAIIIGIVIATIHFDTHERLEVKADPIPGGILNPLTTMFTVKNGGGFPFSSYDFYCSVANLQFPGITVTSDISARKPGEPPGVFTVRAEHGKDVELDGSGGSDTLPCLQGYPNPQKMLVECADILVVVDYKIKWIPFVRFSRKWRRVTTKSGAQFDWIEKNNNDPNVYCYKLQ